MLENRKVILSDSSPQAINITFNMLNYINLKEVNKIYKDIISNLEDEINNLYKVKLNNLDEGYAETIIRSHIYFCPECGQEVILYGSATGKRCEYKCKSCGRLINISKRDDKAFLKEKRKPVEANIVLTKSDNKKIN